MAAATWFFIAVAWAFRLVISRGLWSTRAVDTAAFVDLLIRDCRATLAATIFGAVMFVCLTAFCLAWIYRYATPHMPWWRWLLFSNVAIDLVWVATVAFFGFLVWYRRRKRAELAWLQNLRT